MRFSHRLNLEEHPGPRGICEVRLSGPWLRFRISDPNQAGEIYSRTRFRPRAPKRGDKLSGRSNGLLMTLVLEDQVKTPRLA